MNIMYTDNNGKTIDTIEGVKGIRLVRNGSDINDWGWAYKFYYQDAASEWNFIKFKSLVAFVDAQNSRINPDDLDIEDIAISRYPDGFEYYTKDIL